MKTTNFNFDFQKTLQNVVSYFFPGNCFDEIVVKLDVFHKRCSQILLSRLLGVAITLGSSFLLVPQIIKIQSGKSGAGISVISQVLALIAAASTAAYSYEKKYVFGQWGDALFVAIQTLIIIMQILYFNGNKWQAIVAMLITWAIGLAVTRHYIPLKVLETVQASIIPLIILSKGVQIISNYKQRGTGQLSSISVMLQLSGCAARVFTSIQETAGDKFLIGQFLVATLLNGIIFGQIIYYSYGLGKKKKVDGKPSKKSHGAHGKKKVT